MLGTGTLLRRIRILFANRLKSPLRSIDYDISTQLDGGLTILNCLEIIRFRESRMYRLDMIRAMVRKQRINMSSHQLR